MSNWISKVSFHGKIWNLIYLDLKSVLKRGQIETAKSLASKVLIKPILKDQQVQTQVRGGASQILREYQLKLKEYEFSFLIKI